MSSRFLLGFVLGFCFIQSSFAQSKSSYEDRLSQIAGKESDRHLGTISGRDKNEQRKKELFEAYTYVPRDAVKEELFNKDYVDFRNEHKVPNYIGDDKAKEALKKAKDETIKTEVVKIVEAEKLLHDTFQSYHEEKNKIEIESSLLKTIGNKKDTGFDKQKKEMDERIDIIGDKTASILSTSIQKLATSNLIQEPESRGEVYMASGGRVFPKLSLDEDKDFLNVRSKVMDRVQKDLMTALASAINEFYHVEQKETAKAEIEKKEQLLAFVRVEDKAEGRDINKVERIQAIQEFISKMDRNPNDSSSEGGMKVLSQDRINEIKQKLAELIKTLSGDDKKRFEQMSGSFNRATDAQTGQAAKFHQDYDPIGPPEGSLPPVSAQPAGRYDQGYDPVGPPEGSMPSPTAEPGGRVDQGWDPVGPPEQK